MKTICSWHPRTKKRPSSDALRRLVGAAAEAAGLEGDFTISAVFTSEKEMAELNESALGHHGPTDVISFDYRTPGMPEIPDPDTASVEIFVCPAVAEREAAKRGLPYSSEVTLYTAHGFLHIAGEDDLEPAKKRRMRRAEKRVMKKLMEKFDLERIFGV